jgi:hypothetical protein
VSIAGTGSRGAEAVVQAYGSADLAPGAGDAGAWSVTTSSIARPLCRRFGRPATRGESGPVERPSVIPDRGGAYRARSIRPDPSRRDDLDQLIQWQMKKSLPFASRCVDHALAGRRSMRAASSSSLPHAGRGR